MAKFSLKFKQKVAEKYLKGELSLISVGEMFNISPSTVRKWAYVYREHGLGTLTGKKGRYEDHFKLMVVRDIVDEQLSIREAAVKYGIPAFYTVSLWLEKYRKYGDDAFSKKNRKASIMSSQSPDSQRLAPQQLTSLTRSPEQPVGYRYIVVMVCKALPGS
ncbi:helix-turn-helix domain-containing protein [Raoultella ornithinolytica]|uniref:helix-turn-helix domain-containing protein n=1 Tax=Raoultella ornithinolytica TaxID=54291 RepID=UPI0021AF8E98|nr:helix-turn-helix domain-containing protein [Raoultella ornithinolytica]MCT4737241.1 helix-turn-helix domain-containing protein [Raoultella ornithinolytica]